MDTRSMVQDSPAFHTGRLGSDEPSRHPPRVDESALSKAERETLVRTLPALSTDPLLRIVGMMKMGAMLLAIDGRVAYLNEAGKEALMGQTGLTLHGDRVVAVVPEVRRKLAAALTQACRPPYLDGAVLLSPGPGRGLARPLRILSMERITGLSRSVGEGMALLCVGGMRPRQPDATMLSQLFGLTVTEAALMASIAGGERLHQCATRRGVSLATVRAQLRNVFVKTGAATQADLTQIAWSIPGLWIN